MPSPSDQTAVDSDADTTEDDLPEVRKRQETLDPLPSLYRNTDSFVHYPACSGGGETLALEEDLYAETQVVEEWAETQVVTEREEDDRTEVLSDCNDDSVDVADDGTSVAVVNSNPDYGGDDNEMDNGCGNEVEDVTPASEGNERSSGSKRRFPGCSLYEQNIPSCSKLDMEKKIGNVGKAVAEDRRDYVVMVDAALNVSSHGNSAVNGHSSDKTVDHYIFKYHDMEGQIDRSSNGVVRSLFQEDTHGTPTIEPPKEHFSTVDEGLPEASGFPIVGLSYVGSQEPGEISQANAIEVVDRLLLNDFEISEVPLNGENVEVALPPSLGTKGVQFLAKLAPKSPAQNKEAFEWDDVHEDEGGGDFFVKTKKTLFLDDEKKNKSQRQRPKSRKSCQKSLRKTTDNGKSTSNAKKDESYFEVSPKPVDHRGHNSSIRGNLVFKTPERARKKSVLKHSQKKLNKNVAMSMDEYNIGTDANVFHDIGPDTQMAAEAMEALMLVSVDDPNAAHKNHATISPKHLMQSECLNREHLGFTTIRKKRSSLVPESDNTVRRSKRLKMSMVNSNPLETNNSKHKHMGGESASDIKVAAKDSLNEKKNSKFLCRSSEIDKIKKGEKYEISQKRTKIDHYNSRIENADFNQMTDMGSTPISRRTRQSTAKNPEKPVNLTSICFCSTPAVDVAAKSESKKVNSKPAGSAALQLRNRKQPHRSKKSPLTNQYDSSKILPQETRPVTVIFPFHHKRRRTCISKISEDLTLLQNDEVAAPRSNSVMEKHGEDGKEKSVTCYLPSDCQVNVNGSDPHYSHVSTSHFEIIESPKSEVLQKEKSHFSYTYKSPVKSIIEGSPICVGNVPLNTVHKEASKSSVARELIRLVSSDTIRIPVLKELQKKDMSSICVLFSRHLEEKAINYLSKIAKRLGISIASSISDATHFITDKFVRTRNLLEAMAVGKPVVTSMWLKKCGQVSSFVDEKNYLLRDLEKEKEIGFSMPVSLACSSQNPLLQSKRVFITSNSKPDQKTVSTLVKAAGGQPVERMGRSAMSDDNMLDDLLVISCEEDYPTCTPFLEKGLKIFSSELILNGIVIQKLEYERHRLFLDHVKQTRSTIWLKNQGSKQFHPVARKN